MNHDANLFSYWFSCTNDEERVIWARIVTVLASLIVVSQIAAAPPSLGDKVVAFCQERLNTTVGNGECAGLATQALKAAGAQSRAGLDSPNQGDYVWGKQICLLKGTPDGLKEEGELSDVQPGDIMQYRDVRFGDKGHFSHHTAVVVEVDARKKVIKVYQQNAGGQRIVTEGNPHLKTLVAGWIRIYRPLPEDR